MDQPSTDVIQGTLDLLIPKTLSLDPLHGFGMARRMKQLEGEADEWTWRAAAVGRLLKVEG